MNTHTGNLSSLELEVGDDQLLSRAQLIARWQHGSDSFFWRAEADGLLVPVRKGRETRYRWPEVFRFEGGDPPEGLKAAYRADLLRPEQVARCVSWRRARVIAEAKRGLLPFRSVGLQVRFVPAEVARWMSQWT